MVLTALALLLFSAEPDPSFAVVATATPGLERVASSAGSTLAERLELEYVELGGYLKTVGPGCSADLRCLSAAPTLLDSKRVLHLRVSPLSGGKLSAGELATWAEKAATRLFARTSASARTLPPSPFPARTAGPAPASLPPPPVTPPVPPPTQIQSVRGADEEP